MRSTNLWMTKAKSEKLAWRLAHIISLLHQGDALDKRELAENFKVDVRTIERDLHERLHGIAERGADGCWQLTHAARGTIPASQLLDHAELAGTLHLFPDNSLRYLLEQLAITPESRGLHVHPVSQEDLRHQQRVFSQLQAAVQQRQPCRFTYKGKPRSAQPYRVHHKNGVWYLAAAETEGDVLKNFSIARIEALSVDEDQRFTPNPEHLAYLDEQQDVWFTRKPTDVLLRVASEVAHYFTRRPLLPHQQQRTDTDGSLLVNARIHHPQQLLPIVRYWLPHVHILRPVELHDALMDGLRQAIDHGAPQSQPQRPALSGAQEARP